MPTFTKSTGLLIGTALLASTAPLTIARAQEAPGPEASDGDAAHYDEIVVTAQKRTERLQDVPLAVSSVGGDALAASQVSSSGGIAALVPSLTFTDRKSTL